MPVEANLAGYFRTLCSSAGVRGQAVKILNNDYYFDTPDRLIAKRGAAWRLRYCSGRYEVTVKSATAIVNGLASRTEVTKPLKAGSLKKALALAAAGNPFGFANVGVLFRISNRRVNYKLNHEGCLAEISFDNVTIFAAGKAVRMKEIELELLSGSKAAFAKLAAVLAKAGKLEPCKQSKVATARAALAAFDA